ncbi:ATP-binding protein [Eubacterium sp. MSJ-13]|uniref:ATP-binding protein n=1 Tax=Eubacterium sp. MSJ-13 TaxID=2841513 RepID=UPI0035301586
MLNMEDQDIVVILTNMLNNAIEACEKCTGKKIIRVKAIKENKKVIFSVSNTFQKIPHFVNGKYITTKKEPFHGMGIENVKDIVGKYHGTCAICYDKEQFYFVVYLSE